MFFAALFASYFNVRASNASWPPPGVHLDVVESSFGTLLLFLSSLVMLLTTRALDRGKVGVARWWTATAIICALSFIALSLHGYSKNSFTIATNAYGSVYYAMTGFHLLHVTAGLGLLTALLVGLQSPALRANHRAGAEAMSYYWHFVFIVWVGIWGTIYFIR